MEPRIKPQDDPSGSIALVAHVDGGARGNPGPAAAGVVVRSADADATVLFQGGFFLGETTNNVAEYRGLIAALDAAARLNANKLTVHSDSELMVRQVNGQYRVRQPHLQELHDQVRQRAETFVAFRIIHVRREHNKDADRLVNQAINGRRNVEDAAEIG